MSKKLSPFWLKFGRKLSILFCEHKGDNDEWGYRYGTGIVEQYCNRCGRVIKKVPLDDLSKSHFDSITEIIQKKMKEDEEDD